MMAIAILMSLVALITPLFLTVWGKEQTSLTTQRVLMLLLIMLASQGFSLLFTVLRERFAKDYNKTNLCALLSHILKMDYDQQIEQGAMNLLEKALLSVNSIYAFMTGDNIKIWSSTLIALACLILLSLINLWLALLLALLIPINYLGYRFLNQELARRCQRMQEDTSAGFQEMLSCLQQTDYLKQSATHGPLMAFLEPSLEKTYGSMARVNAFAQSASGLLSGINDIARNFSLVFLVYRFSLGQSSPYALMLFTILLPLYFSGINAITNANLRKKEYEVALSFQNEVQNNIESDGHQPLKKIEQISLDLKCLHLPGFTLPFYAKGTYQKGDIIQVLGSSGSGKSSFAKALLKFRKQEGILINGEPLSSLKNADLRQHIEYLSQNVPIIKGSLRDNLFFNLPWSKQAEDAFMKAPILQSVLNNKTMDTQITEGGANLSGGEKQKIALARALLQARDVLVLDEVCSNIDQASTDAIYEQLEKQREQRICFVITHESLPKGLANAVINAPMTRG